MSLIVPIKMLQQADPGPLDRIKENAEKWRAETYKVEPYELTDEVLEALRLEGTLWENKSFTRVVESIQASRAGNFAKVIPKISAGEEMLRLYLKAHLIDGWVYRTEADGHLHPYLVTRVAYDAGSLRNDGDGPHINIYLIANSSSSSDRVSRYGINKVTVRLNPENVTNKMPGDVLMEQGLYVETEALKQNHMEEFARYKDILYTGFSNQYIMSGGVFSSDSRYSRSETRIGHKVVHNIAPAEIPSITMHAPSNVFEPEADSGEIPAHTVLHVFDLKRHDYLWVNTVDVAEYEFDQTLRYKLILPDDQQELLDILTTDIKTFSGDIIDGKSSGNVIMCKGLPGVGKTLSAEVYAELIGRPLYAIHSGSLGITADKVRANLEEIFAQVQRWNAVLLLDEADVFVLERGSDIAQNAIVAEFLRTLEYFDGLMFMTTNRANNIDDAILSRCAAIIDYVVPGVESSRKIWEVLATNNGVKLEEKLLDELTIGFAGITPRDIKMLLRLALRVSASRGQKGPSIETFRQCAIFRGLHYQKTDNSNRNDEA